MPTNATCLANSPNAWIVGIDLAWGDRKGDGLCLLRANRTIAEVCAVHFTRGDTLLFEWLKQNIPFDEPTLVLIDTPLIMINKTGGRPVDRKTHEMFHRENAGCYPANLTKCARPARIGRLLEEEGYRVDFDLQSSTHIASEVYPHPAMVRLFHLNQIVKYKKGVVSQKRKEFSRLQDLLLKCLVEHFPKLILGDEVRTLLQTTWSKTIEDRTDALFCALIGYHHWMHHGTKSDPIGDIKTGFILLPSETRSIT